MGANIINMEENTKYLRKNLYFCSVFFQKSTKMTIAENIIWVGLSGGPDSVAALLWLREQGHTVIATHCNFQLRGEESERDEQFCRSLCERLGVELQCIRFDTRKYMKENGLSLEMAARELRYEWWKALREKAETEHPDQRWIMALGHHRDDSMETMLMNLMRGTGIKGLTGIVEWNEETHVWRPLIQWSRAEILDYLSQHGQDYITDSSNLETDVMRNQVRNLLLPLMEKICPTARQGLTTTMHNLAETDAIADRWLDATFEQETRVMEVDGIVWYEWNKQPDLEFEWRRWIRRKTSDPVRDHGTMLYTEPDVSQAIRTASLSETIDADKVCLPLVWRRWQKNDRIAPLGMRGHTKLVSDLFSNAHYSPMQKATAWVVADAEGVIVWIPGLRLSEICKITADTTHTLTIGYNE